MHLKHGPTGMNPSTCPRCCFHCLCAGSCLSSRRIVVLAAYKYMCVYMYIEKQPCDCTEMHLVFHVFYFRFISAEVICLFLLCFSLYLTPYSSVKYQEKEPFSTFLNYYISSVFTVAPFDGQLASNLGATINLTCDIYI